MVGRSDDQNYDEGFLDGAAQILGDSIRLLRRNAAPLLTRKARGWKPASGKRKNRDGQVLQRFGGMAARGVQLSLAIYKLTSSFPDSERFGLINQLRRASVSIASNIAEGYGRSTKGEYLLFLGHARGSNFELQTQLLIAEGQGFGNAADRRAAESRSQEVSRMLVAIMGKLRVAR